MLLTPLLEGDITP